MFDFLQQHQLVVGAVAALVASAAVRALPAATASGSRFYLWFYNFTHLILSNYDKLGNGKPASNGTLAKTGS
jgi:hypothetical protein